jgi:uncharacterized protein YjbJ (UPF0337 family)
MDGSARGLSKIGLEAAKHSNAALRAWMDDGPPPGGRLKSARPPSETKHRPTVIWYPTHSEDTAMDKDRIKGSVEQANGSVKEAAGKVLGDKKLETEGTTEKAAGKVQNAIGGLKDAVRGK